jgi:hypothetical protein
VSLARISSGAHFFLDTVVSFFVMLIAADLFWYCLVVDGAGFDETRQEAYASGGDGTLTVVKEESPDSFHVIETTATRSGARTMVVDERTHRLYLSAAERGRALAPTAQVPHPRPPIMPDTFEVLVLEP